MNEELFEADLKRHETRINSLTSMLKWLIGTMITTLVGFFIFAVQRGIF